MEMALDKKIETIAKEIYGADGIELSEIAQKVSIAIEAFLLLVVLSENRDVYSSRLFCTAHLHG